MKKEVVGAETRQETWKRLNPYHKKFVLRTYGLGNDIQGVYTRHERRCREILTGIHDLLAAQKRGRRKYERVTTSYGSIYSRFAAPKLPLDSCRIW